MPRTRRGAGAAGCAPRQVYGVGCGTVNRLLVGTGTTTPTNKLKIY